jgi:hypothetical protein
MNATIFHFGDFICGRQTPTTSRVWAGGPSYREAKGGAFDFLSITKILCTPSQTPHPPDVTMILTGKAATASTL